MLKTSDIKAEIVDFHRKRGFRILKSFPLVSNDPTVMFVNATITPFKHWFTNPDINPQNCALFQKCFRMGGAKELEFVGANPYYHTYFDMFGSVIFDMNHTEAIEYLLALLNVLGFEKKRLYFTIPNDSEFRHGFIVNSVDCANVFTLEKNDAFWQEWEFGNPGPVGRGITVIYSRSEVRVRCIEQMIKDPEQFVEMLNLIYVYAQKTKGGTILPIVHQGFDLGVGIERLAAAIQGCNNYQIDSIYPLVGLVMDFLSDTQYHQNHAIARTITDHLRAICILIEEGLMPSNKKHGYVLRKLIRKVLEIIWTAAGKMIELDELIKNFCEYFKRQGTQLPSFRIVAVVIEESRLFITSLKRAVNILDKQPGIEPELLRSTYGLPPSLVSILKKGEKNE